MSSGLANSTYNSTPPSPCNIEEVPDIVFVCLVVLLPWITGGAIIMFTAHRKSKRTWVVWCTLGLAVAMSCIIRDNAACTLVDALTDSATRAIDSVEFVLSVATPLLVLPVAIFFARSVLAETTAKSQGTVEMPQQTRDQAYLVTFILKVAIAVYVSFGIIGRCGLSLDGVVDLATVMSIGVSWSMRDWLTSAWAGLVIACCTDLSSNCTLQIGTSGASPHLKVIRCVPL